MEKTILGLQIQALRKDKGITQEELGKELGVTAQAVSNWECGGMPDASLLPAIADFFEVTIDHLYGRTDEIKQDLGKQLTLDLYQTPKADRFEKAYGYCWCIQKGLFDAVPEILENSLQDKVSIPGETKTSSVLLFEEGITYMRANDEVHNFFMMPIPDGGYKSKLLEAGRYEEFYAVLGRPDRVRVLLFLYGRKVMAVSAERVAKLLNMTEKAAKEILEDLCSLRLLYTLEVDVEEGNSVYYKINDYYPDAVLLIPFLFISADLIEKPVYTFNNTSGKVPSML